MPDGKSTPIDELEEIRGCLAALVACFEGEPPTSMRSQCVPQELMARAKRLVKAGVGESVLDWEAAVAHLDKIRHAYTVIGASGIPALTIAINPLLVAYEGGDRSAELWAQIMALE